MAKELIKGDVTIQDKATPVLSRVEAKLYDCQKATEKFDKALKSLERSVSRMPAQPLGKDLSHFSVPGISNKFLMSEARMKREMSRNSRPLIDQRAGGNLSRNMLVRDMPRLVAKSIQKSVEEALARSEARKKSLIVPNRRVTKYNAGIDTNINGARRDISSKGIMSKSGAEIWQHLQNKKAAEAEKMKVNLQNAVITSALKKSSEQYRLKKDLETNMPSMNELRDSVVASIKSKAEAPMREAARKEAAERAAEQRTQNVKKLESMIGNTKMPSMKELESSIMADAKARDLQKIKDDKVNKILQMMADRTVRKINKEEFDKSIAKKATEERTALIHGKEQKVMSMIADNVLKDINKKEALKKAGEASDARVAEIRRNSKAGIFVPQGKMPASFFDDIMKKNTEVMSKSGILNPIETYKMLLKNSPDIKRRVESEEFARKQQWAAKELNNRKIGKVTAQVGRQMDDPNRRDALKPSLRDNIRMWFAMSQAHLNSRNAKAQAREDKKAFKRRIQKEIEADHRKERIDKFKKGFIGFLGISPRKPKVTEEIGSGGTVSGTKRALRESGVFMKGNGFLSRIVNGAMSKMPLWYTVKEIAQVLGEIFGAVVRIADNILKSGDEERKLEQKMTISPSTFGVDRDDDKGKDAFIKKMYDDAHKDNMNGLNGKAIMQSTIEWAHLLGADPNNQAQSKFKNLDETNKFARALNAIVMMNGVDQRQQEVFRYQMTQVAAKGYAGRLDVKPMQESSPAILAEIQRTLGMTNEQMLHAGETKELTWEKMKGAMLALEEKYVMMARQERLQTSEGQREVGMSEVETSMHDFNNASAQVIQTEGQFVMFKMFADMIRDMGDAMFGSTEKLMFFRKVMETTFIILDLIARTIYAIGAWIMAFFRVLWNVAQMVFRAYMIPQFLLAITLLQGIVGLIGTIYGIGKTLWVSVKWGISSLGEWLWEMISEIPVLGKKDFVQGALSEARKSAKEGRQEYKDLDKLDKFQQGIKGIQDWADRTKHNAWIDTKDRMRADWNDIKDTGRNAAYSTMRMQKGFAEDVDKIMLYNTKFADAPKLETDVEQIKKNTGRGAKASEKASKAIEILREIAGYQVINKVTRVRPDLQINFGDIRSEAIPADKLLGTVTEALKRAEPSFASIGNGNVDTVTAPAAAKVITI